jgi:hypothetical protein
MFNCIRDINRGAINAGRLEALTQKFAGWAYKRPCKLIFPIARLLADKNNPGIGSSFTKDYLLRVPVQITSAAVLSRCSQAGDVPPCRQEGCGRPRTWMQRVHRSFGCKICREGQEETVTAKVTSGFS